MELERLTERIWFYPYEEERDRPNLGYIRGDRWSIAVDAGHSAAHTEEFYAAIERAGLPLPEITVLTHWHWDHTFGMHRVHGLCLADRLTNGHLLECLARIKEKGEEEFFSFDERIRREYEGGKPVIVVPADIVFSGETELDPGGCPVKVFQSEAPHTDDSAFIHVPGESVLFIGDAACGALPEWERDPEKSRKLAEMIANTGAEICLDGHYIPQKSQEVISELMNG